jgi:hypothetical protein
MALQRRLMVKAAANGRRRLVANMMGGPGNITGGSGTSSITAYSGQGLAPLSLMLGIVSEDERALQAMYQDIYNYDSVGGTTADMKSTMISSDFNLTGFAHPSNEAIYRKNLERLGFPEILPTIHLDRYVRGAYLSTLLYREDTKTFTGQMPHNIADCEVTPSPIFGMGPHILMRTSESLRKFLSNQSDYCKSIRDQLNPDMVRQLQSKEVELEPLATLFLPRRTMSNTSTGMSIFRRLIPLYALERLLYRGTLSEAQKRQRSIMHITGGSDSWEPNEEELTSVLNLFQQAELDPIGAIVATRNDIQVNEVRNGGDFWKWTDIIDITTTIKLRALGVSETFLSGESSYNAMEVALSVFIENARGDRDEFTRDAFHSGLFPLIAHTNGLMKASKVSGVVVAGDESNVQMQFNMADTAKYDIPRVEWQKSLRPEADEAYFGILEKLEDKGLPIPIAMWAGAGGVDLKSMMEGQQSDIKLRKRIEAVKQDLVSDGASDNEVEAALELLDREIASMGGRTPRSVLDRDFGDMSDIYTRSVTGKKKWIPNQHTARKRRYGVIASARDRLATDDAVWESRQAQARRLVKNNLLVQSDGSIKPNTVK